MKNSCLIILLGVTIFQVNAQNTPLEAIQASTDLMRTISHSQKVEQKPQTHDSVMELGQIRYYLEPVYQELEFEVVPIQPAKLKVIEPLEKLYSGYLFAGVGNYTMPYLQGYYNSQRSKKGAWGINGKYHAALSGMKNLPDTRFNESNLGGFYKTFFKKSTFETSLNYTRNHYNTYGFGYADSLIPVDLLSNKDTIDRTYHTFGFKASLISAISDTAAINYTTVVKYGNLIGKNVQEHNPVVSGSLFKYSNKEEFGAEMDVDLNFFKFLDLAEKNCLACNDSLMSNNVANAIVSLRPYIHTRSENWEIRAGLGIFANISEAAKFHFYPMAEANYKLFNNIFVPYVGVKGGIKRNNFTSLQAKNPYLLESQTLRNTNEKVNIYAGIRGSVSSTVSFNLTVSQQKLETMPLFVIDTFYTFGNQFKVIYDTMSITQFQAQIGYQKLEKLKFFLKGAYNIYDVNNQAHPWNLPVWQFTLSGVYDLADKLLARMDVFVVGDRFTYGFQDVGNGSFVDYRYIYKLSPFVDANLSFEYRYNKRLSAFLNINNLVAKRYQYWQNYPVQRINVLGGVSYAF